jgi:hypothetical protein
VEVSDKIQYWYDMGKEQRDECGFKGHEWVCGDEAMMSARAMCGLFIDHMDTAFDKWTPRKRFEIMGVK